ncbi:MAG: phenylacetate-CoA oxygenase subunit PaaJ [Saprospiraceae bacterium]|nr:phenylacetate-CoA oxygenase subunit PaaJ [Saprospiraceae bacterium]
MVGLLENITDENLKAELLKITDPEIPVLTVFDLGVIRKINVVDKHVNIDITPTYSGCPAMDTISMDLKVAIESLGYTANINLVLAPAWTTDWISEEGKKKLEEYGIAAPLTESLDKRALIDGEPIVKCPNCSSTNTKLVSQFGSTACKALFKCNDCLEPFDYFKCLK